MLGLLAVAFSLVAQDLPSPPDGLQVREVVKLGPADDSQPVRVQPHPKSGLLYVLYLNGDLWQVDPDKGAKKKVLARKDYFRADAAAFVQALGLHIDASGLVYIVVNERHDDETPRRSHVCVYRITDSDGDQVPDKAEAWLQFDHPWGIGPYNHGANHLAIGPDGQLYLSVGSRTDHGEAGKDSEKLRLDTHGETPLTACLLRIDPKASPPKTELFAQGLRNSFGFDWDEQERLIASENGPDADHPEELNWVRQGKHYGFPYRFGNQALPMYPDAAVAPEGLVFERPIANLGPSARPKAETEFTFDPHCSPSGVIYYRKGTLPEKYEHSFFIARFGNYLGKEPVGFDLLNVRLSEKNGALEGEFRTVLEKLRRPIDLCQWKGKIYILEYITYDAQRPSRLLELSGQ
ncbi:MAG TPA: PQQ-dependent sugar dehydrogenase [Planctomycetota bacterium]|nr:PQQ-dependent sugar dehydrogenase [Planctomycetota bacterium]